jgi:hypothetical protein
VVEPYSGCQSDIQLSDIMARPETQYDTKWIAHLIDGYVDVDGMQIPVIKRTYEFKDKLGTIMVRCGLHRMNYHFPAGLYLIGEQAPNLPVLVSCNYKLTLDKLRTSLKGKGYWLLILDTKGVNVWCAAGKGTFGTEELIFQLTKWRVKTALKVKEVILPQLGASRMTPHIVQKLTGLKVNYGPIRAEDIDAYLANKRVATETQRTVTFTWKERLVLTPIEFLMSLRYVVAIYPFMVLWNYLNFRQGLSLVAPVFQTLPWLLMLFTGAVLFPLALPALPTKGFSTKGAILGLPAVALVLTNWEWFALGNDPLQWTAWSIGYLLCIGYLALNFTGSTTFTPLSGVAYEVKLFKKYAKGLGAVAVLMMIVSFFV